MNRNVFIPVGWLTVVALAIVLSGCGEGNHGSALEQLDHHDTTAVKAKNDVRRDTIAVSYKEQPLYALARVKKITKYPCSNCHVSGGDVTRDAKRENRRAHWNLELNHGDGHLECASCHFGDDMDSLQTMNGDTVSYDQSYKVCGQCHFEQLKDWKGGAHGKQVQGWGKPRVIYNCSTCHDPHDPAYEKRWPVTFPSVPRTVDDFGS